MAVFAELSSDLFFRDILRLELDIQAVLAGDFDQVEFLADLRNNEAKIKPVSICDSDAFFCESIHKDPERIDFMQDLSSLYGYAQLPVRFEDREANSDLFVYMNKKSIKQAKDQVSALLHLDMDHLGPTDCHVSLRGTVVQTKFYVEDALSAKLIDQHMSMLEQAVAENGFTLSNETILREPTLDKAKVNPVVQEIVGNDLEKSVKRYSFDVRM